uniref:liprin-beta-2-like n=1 Tax=Styela clava TaxID=7725 RepID=UPI0019398523|nr:liprin-beta-2-like [Styela clava]
MDSNSQRAASDMLEDALQQFDSMIGAGTGDTSSAHSFIGDGYHGIGQLLDDLRISIQAEQISPEDSGKLLSILPMDTLNFYQGLFKCSTNDNTDSKILQKFRNENDSLTLQVSVLSDQVELQMEKMEELISGNKDLQSKLLSTEELLQKEIRATTERERELVSLREQLRQKERELEKRERTVKITPPSVINQVQENEVLSPDEGIGQDNGEDTHDGPRPSILKMPVPNATSTPISTLPGNEGRHHAKFDDSTPQKPPGPLVEGVVTPKKTPNQQIRSVSLERLHGKKILPLDESQDVHRSSSQSEHLNSILKDSSTPVSKNISNNKSDGKSNSSPNLAITEQQGDAKIEQDQNFDLDEFRHGDNSHESPFQNRKKHGFRKFFNSFRLRRSNSSNLQSDSASLQSWGGKSGKNRNNVKVSENPQNFTRGGFRATAGPRLGASKPKLTQNTTSPFAQWNTTEVTDWLIDLGLEAYVENCKNWVKSGATLLQATNQDIEKELGVHNPLHKKKLMLSLQALGDEDEIGGEIIKGVGMDHVTVARWLDDIGLPQYKEAFHKARIDCRMLHHLTIGDLQRLRITNLLHTLSFRRAIYTLRNIKFDPLQLKRRPVDETVEKEDVALWTNHRVMEWLRSIDLAEYAPNLRGSGVHGSLIIMEPQFSGEILSSLLHIPTSKSLLRRHLIAKFNELLPPDSLASKQKEASSMLNIAAKVKIGRRSFGPLSRLKGLGSSGSREFSNGEYVCPFETKNSASHNSFGAHRRNLGTKLHGGKKGNTWDISDEQDIEPDDISDDSTGNIKIVELDESATKKIGAFSAELATMTNKWSED